MSTICVFPGAPLATLLPRLLPHAASTPEARSLLARLELPIASDGGNGGAAPYAFESKVATMHSLRGLPPLNAQAATR